MPVEVITRGERRRAWTADQKREIVVESLGPELTPTEVARKLGLVTRSAPSFAQVEMTPVPRPVDAPAPKLLEPVPPPMPAAALRPEGLIEIVLPGGVSVRVDAQVDGLALRRVLGALEGR